jgi:predicted transcriptional regulator
MMIEMDNSDLSIGSLDSIAQPSDALPDRDAEYIRYVHDAIERGLADSASGRTTPIENLRARYNLQP